MGGSRSIAVGVGVLGLLALLALVLLVRPEGAQTTAPSPSLRPWQVVPPQLATPT